MKTLKISLNSIDKVKAFVNEISKFDCDFDLVSGRYVIDAKSIMGIFSLDLSKPINLNITDPVQAAKLRHTFHTAFIPAVHSGNIPDVRRIFFACF